MWTANRALRAIPLIGWLINDSEAEVKTPWESEWNDSEVDDEECNEDHPSSEGVQGLEKQSSKRSDNETDREIRELLRLWEEKRGRGVKLSEEELTEFQLLLRAWEELVRTGKAEHFPKSYVQPSKIGNAYFGIHGIELDRETTQVASAATTARDRIERMSALLEARNRVSARSTDTLPDLGASDPCLSSYHFSMDFESMNAFLPANVVMRGKELNDMWTAVLKDTKVAPFGEKESQSVDEQLDYSYHESTSTFEYKRYFPRLAYQKSPRRLALRQILNRDPKPERQTQLDVPFSLKEARNNAVVILRELGASALVCKSNGRKLKMSFLNKENVHGHCLIVAVHLFPIKPNVTRITFLRSKDDGRRASSGDFLRKFNALHLQFLRLTETN